MNLPDDPLIIIGSKYGEPKLTVESSIDGLNMRRSAYGALRQHMLMGDYGNDWGRIAHLGTVGGKWEMWASADHIATESTSTEGHRYPRNLVAGVLPTQYDERALAINVPVVITRTDLGEAPTWPGWQSLLTLMTDIRSALRGFTTSRPGMWEAAVGLTAEVIRGCKVPTMLTEYGYIEWIASLYMGEPWSEEMIDARVREAVTLTADRAESVVQA